MSLVLFSRPPVERGPLKTCSDNPDPVRGLLLRSLRVCAGISLREAAVAIGCGIAEISNAERANIALPPEEWDRLVRLLEKRVEERGAGAKALDELAKF